LSVPSRTVLITGATGGIGAALAAEYAEPGHTLLLQGRDAGALRALGESCGRRGAQVRLLPHDLADAAGWMQALARADAETPVDLAFMNAGVAATTANGLEPWPDVQAMLDVNLRAGIGSVSVLAPGMCRRGAGHLVLVGSLSAWVGMPLSPTYCATKAGLKAYAEAMRGALAPAGVAVTLVQPGFVHTPMSQRFAAPKPFMVSADAAARHIRRALRHRPARVAFPGLLSLGMQGLALLPVDLAQAVLRRLGYGAGGQPGGQPGGSGRG